MVDDASGTELTRLLDAVIAVGSELSLPVVLRRIVETAVELVGAGYGALGVLDDERQALQEFLYVGISEEFVAAMHDVHFFGDPRHLDCPVDGAVAAAGDHDPFAGEIPDRANKVLHAEPRPLRLPDLTAHPDSYGWPPGHPPMTSFLGVPIRVRGEVFGNLYLTDKAGGGAFTPADEDLTVALAATAGMAIENARLHSRLAELLVVEDRERIARGSSPPAWPSRGWPPG